MQNALPPAARRPAPAVVHCPNRRLVLCFAASVLRTHLGRVAEIRKRVRATPPLARPDPKPRRLCSPTASGRECPADHENSSFVACRPLLKPGPLAQLNPGPRSDSVRRQLNCCRTAHFPPVTSAAVGRLQLAGNPKQRASASSAGSPVVGQGDLRTRNGSPKN